MVTFLDRIFNTALILAVILMSLLHANTIIVAHAQQDTIFRDSQGRTIGSAQTDSQGNVTFRDSGGRTTGKASGG
jgi:hypothetical protein